MLFIKILFTAVFLFTNTAACFCQKALTVDGLIIDGSSGDPIFSANVFISNTTWGAASDKEGRFSIERVKPGNFDLVITMMGYKKIVRPVIIPVEKPLRIVMEPAVLEMEAVTVTGKRQYEWRLLLRRFNRFFLGSTPNARSTRLLNPEVLDLEMNASEGTLTAAVQEPLKVKNEALGYTIIFHMKDFVSHEHFYCKYLGEIQFIAMNAPDDQTQKMWEKNRLKTYEGSMAHFLKSVIQGQSRENKFRVYRLSARPGGDNYGFQSEFDPDTLVSAGIVKNQSKILFPKYMLIDYTGAREPDEYIEDMYGAVRPGGRFATDIDRVRRGSQRSWIETHFSPLTVYETGHLSMPYLVTVYGYWAWQRFADLLPFDYEPE